MKLRAEQPDLIRCRFVVHPRHRRYRQRRTGDAQHHPHRWQLSGRPARLPWCAALQTSMPAAPPLAGQAAAGITGGPPHEHSTGFRTRSTTQRKDKALAEMRGLFGRNGAASRWSRLPTRARAVICYAAGVSTTQAGRELDQFDFDQQEAIRLALGN